MLQVYIYIWNTDSVRWMCMKWGFSESIQVVSVFKTIQKRKQLEERMLYRLLSDTTQSLIQLSTFYILEEIKKNTERTQIVNFSFYFKVLMYFFTFLLSFKILNSFQIREYMQKVSHINPDLKKIYCFSKIGY